MNSTNNKQNNNAKGAKTYTVTHYTSELLDCVRATTLLYNRILSTLSNMYGEAEGERRAFSAREACDNLRGEIWNCIQDQINISLDDYENTNSDEILI